ncbi:hypothetical protein K438DRAFT_2008179 [Mycena galopus ATCC 62051]|nr:hypothetical protein K438DRAFT_2008179 [Mycena galopus ATCC 62051]
MVQLAFTLLPAILLALRVPAGPVLVEEGQLISLPISRRFNLRGPLHRVEWPGAHLGLQSRKAGSVAARASQPVFNQVVSYYAYVGVGSPATTYQFIVDIGRMRKSPSAMSEPTFPSSDLPNLPTDNPIVDVEGKLSQPLPFLHPALPFTTLFAKVVMSCTSEQFKIYVRRCADATFGPESSLEKRIYIITTRSSFVPSEIVDTVRNAKLSLSDPRTAALIPPYFSWVERRHRQISGEEVGDDPTGPTDEEVIASVKRLFGLSGVADADNWE